MTWVVARRPALLRPRRGADLRAPLRRSRGARRSEAPGRSARGSARARPSRGRVRARDDEGGVAGDPVPGRDTSSRDLAPVRPVGRRSPTRRSRSSRRRAARLRRRPCRATATASSPRRCTGCGAARRTRSAGARRRRTGTPARASSRSVCGVDAAAADRGVRRDRADAGRTTRPAGGTSSRSSLLLGIARLPAARAPRAVAGAALERASTASPPSGGIAAIERRYRRVRAAGRGRAAAAVRRPALRRPLAVRDEDAVRPRVRRDDARLRRSSPLSCCSPGSSTCRALLWPAFLIGLGFASGLSLSGHQGVEPNSSFLTELADWLHLVGGDALGRRPRGRSRSACGRWRRELRRAAFLGFSRLATVLVAVLVLAGTYLDDRASARRGRPVGRRPTAGRCS